MRYIYALLLCAGMGCSRMSTVNINVLQPADITIRPEVHSLLLLNRSLPDNVKINVVEGILTGEGLGQDRQSEQQIVSGMASGLTNSPRFTAKLSGEEYPGSGSGNQFPAPLDWNRVDQLCSQNGVDGIVALETFDSDCITQTGSREVQKTGKDGVKFTVKEFTAQQTVSIKYGLRIYNNKSKSIEDQYLDSYANTWNTTGTTVQDAINSMINRRAALSESCYWIGQQLAGRISPHWSTVARRFYKKGNPEMEKAGRLAMVGNWKDAATVWSQQINYPDQKIAGTAAYNMAVYFETQDDLPGARQWTMKAYADFKNTNALQYARMLDYRMQAQQKLDHQMNAEVH